MRRSASLLGRCCARGLQRASTAAAQVRGRPRSLRGAGGGCARWPWRPLGHEPGGLGHRADHLLAPRRVVAPPCAVGRRRRLPPLARAGRHCADPDLAPQSPQRIRARGAHCPTAPARRWRSRGPRTGARWSCVPPHDLPGQCAARIRRPRRSAAGDVRAAERALSVMVGSPAFARVAPCEGRRRSASIPIQDRPRTIAAGAHRAGAMG